MNEQEGRQSAAEELKSFGDNIAHVYEKYLAVKRLGKTLEGLPPSAPFPTGVAVTHVDITYVMNGETHTARIAHVTRAGDVAELLEREGEKLVDSLRNLAWGAQHTSGQILAACEAAQYSARAQQLGAPE